MIRSRIAPTPSGYLHIGNALNFVLTYAMVRRAGGSLRLRIDDMDAPRARPEYVEDIFRTLDWMGIEWDEGPHSPEEHYRAFSQSLRAQRYHQLIQQLHSTGLTYACTCSRRDLDQCRCRSFTLRLDTPGAAIRITTPDTPVIVHDRKMGEQHISLQEHMHDFVIRRRDGIAAYQVASLADDLDYGIDLIVRGEDLLPSTAAQLYLASLIGADKFVGMGFYHHPLLTDTAGHKLSKSGGSQSLKSMRERGMKSEDFYELMSKYLGLAHASYSIRDIVVAIQL
ncbi:MAG: tRNA glutamyl-Q synthetase [Bacteroidetes bacterium]|nr:tRNA glutamyl-Q synthetase [Bacteroidota bacterium]